MMKRVGLFGGCFNPVHLGHIAASRAAMEHLGLDRIIFIPSGHPPLKGDAGLLDGGHRLAMLNLALADEPRMEASDLELLREGPSFTLDTVRILLNSLPAGTELFFLLGSDCLDRLPSWKGIDALHEMVRFAILPRGGTMPLAADPRLIVIPMPPCAISSTALREALARRETVDLLVPAPVATFLSHHGLYGSPVEVRS